LCHFILRGSEVVTRRHCGLSAGAWFGNLAARVHVAGTMSPARSEPFTFASAADRLVGVLHQPAQQPVASVVTTGPLTSVKEQATGAYARALAERGFAALAFDHRTFGESGGEGTWCERAAGYEVREDA
jgi:hypothetical protein